MVIRGTKINIYEPICQTICFRYIFLQLIKKCVHFLAFFFQIHNLHSLIFYKLLLEVLKSFV